MAPLCSTQSEVRPPARSSAFNDISSLFLLLSLIAEIIGTVGGFGSSVFFVPVANIFFDIQTVLGLMVLFHVFSNLSKIALFRKGLDRTLIIYLGVPAVIFVILGGILTKIVDDYWLEISLGIFLTLFSLLFLLNRSLVIRKGKPEAIIGGTLSGLFAGLLGTGGAIRGITMDAFNLEKSAFVATSAIIDFGVDFSRTGVYFFSGYLNAEVLKYIPFLIIIGWVGTYIGKRILGRISQAHFKRISLFLILGIGLFTLVSVAM